MSRQCRENRFPWNGLRHLGDSGNGGTTLEFLSPFELEAETGSSGCVRDSRASSRVETGMSGNFLSCSKGVKDPLEVSEFSVITPYLPQQKWASSRLEGRTSWIFSSCGRCSHLTMGTSGARSGGLRKGQSPCKLLGGLSGFLSRR